MIGGESAPPSPSAAPPHTAVSAVSPCVCRGRGRCRARRCLHANTHRAVVPPPPPLTLGSTEATLATGANLTTGNEQKLDAELVEEVQQTTAIEPPTLVPADDSDHIRFFRPAAEVPERT